MSVKRPALFCLQAGVKERRYYEDAYNRRPQRKTYAGKYRNGCHVQAVVLLHYRGRGGKINESILLIPVLTR